MTKRKLIGIVPPVPLSALLANEDKHLRLGLVRPSTLWGSAVCDCNGDDDDHVVFDLPLAHPPCLVMAGAGEASVWLSKIPTQSHNPHQWALE